MSLHPSLPLSSQWYVTIRRWIKFQSWPNFNFINTIYIWVV
jgi:hypothetical protein